MPHRDQRVAMEARLESQGLELGRLRDEHARLESEARALRHGLAHAETTLAEGVGAPRRLGRAIVTVVVVLVAARRASGGASPRSVTRTR